MVNKKFIKTFLIMFLIICILGFLKIYGLDFFKSVDNPKEGSENISYVKRGEMFSANSNDVFNINGDILKIKSNELGDSEKYDTYIPFLKSEKDKALIFSCEEGLKNPDKNILYELAESKTDENIDYDARGDLRYVDSIYSKDIKNLNNISRETKNKLIYLMNEIYLNLDENEKEIKKNELFKNAIGKNSENAKDVISDIDIYYVFQMCIWDLIEKKERNFDEIKIVNLNNKQELKEKAKITDSDKLNYLKKIYKYLLEKSENAKNFENPYKRPKLTYNGEKEILNDGIAIKNIRLDISETMLKNIEDLELKIYSNLKREYILVPKDKIFFIDGSKKNSKNKEYIKKKIKENTYKETSFNILIDKKYLEENFGKNEKLENINISRLNLEMKYRYNINIPFVYVSKEENYKSVFKILKNTNKYKIVESLTYNQKDVRAEIGIEKVNNINISGRNLKSEDIDPTNLLNSNNPMGKYTNFEILKQKGRLEVLPNDEIIFNINIYNEGDSLAILGSSGIYIPDDLEINLEDDFNKMYGWRKLDNNIYISDYLKMKTVLNTSKTVSDKNKRIMKIDNENLKIKCKVKQNVENLKTIDIYYKLLNASFNTEEEKLDLSEVVENLNEKKEIDFSLNEDRDSFFLKEDEYIKYFKNLEKKTDDTLSKEEIIINEKEDLALKMNVEEISGIKREDANKETKEEINVKEGEIIKLKLSILNEGEIPAIAKKIAVKIPENLQFEENEANLENGWILENGIVFTEKTGKININKKARHEIYLELRVRSKNIDSADFKIIAEIKDQDKMDIDSAPNNLDFSEKISDKNLENLEDDTDYISFKLLKEDKDLALRMRIIQKGNKEVENRKDFNNNIDFGIQKGKNKEEKKQIKELKQKIKKGDIPKIKYNLPKDNVKVNSNERITLEISVFNEGPEKTKGKKIKVLIPPYLDVLEKEKSGINEKYNWNKVSSKGKIIETDYLAEKEIEGFGKDDKNLLQREIVELELIVKPDIRENEKQLIVAELSKDINGDKDSVSGNINFKYGESDPYEFQKDYLFNLQNEDLSQNKYFIAAEDDDDFESVILKKDSVDLALKMYLDKINGENLKESKEPLVNIKDLLNGRNDAYKTFKNPTYVKKGDVLDFNIKVYNEGEKDATATEIKVYIPENLAYIMEDKTNIENLWKIEEGREPERLSKYINDINKDILVIKGPITLKRTEIKGVGDKPYDLIPKISENNICFKDHKIKLVSLAEDGENKVKKIKFNAPLISENKEEKEEIKRNEEENSENKDSQMLVFAEIAEIYEKDGNKDKDSVPNNFKKDTFSFYNKEDDTDFEVLSSKKIDMDLALKMGVSKIWSDETQRSEQYNRIEETKKTLDKNPLKISPKDKVELKIRVYNEGDLAAYAKKISIYIPDNLEYDKENETNINTKYKTLNKDRIYTNNLDETKILETNVLSYESLKELGKAVPIYEKNKKTGEISFHEIKAVFKVKENINDEKFKIYAKVEDATDIYGNYVNDVDSNFKPLDVFKEKDKNENISIIEDTSDYEIFENIFFDISISNNLEGIGILQRTKGNNFKYIKKDFNKKEKEKKNKRNKNKIKTIKLTKSELRKAQNLEFVYGINVQNKGKIDGFASEIEIKMPENFSISPKNRMSWRNKNKDTIISNDLSESILKTGDTKKLNLILEIDPEKISSTNVRMVSNISKTFNDLNLINLDKNNQNEDIVKIKILDISNKVFYTILLILIVLDISYIFKLLTQKSIFNILRIRKKERKIK